MLNCSKKFQNTHYFLHLLHILKLILYYISTKSIHFKVNHINLTNKTVDSQRKTYNIYELQYWSRSSNRT